MARTVVAVSTLVLTTVMGVKPAAAQSEETAQLAAEHALDEQDLRAAADTVGVSARTYLEGEGVLAPPIQRIGQAGAAPTSPSGAVSVFTLPIDGALGQRLLCIERYESNHTGTARNPSSGARGWLQWLPSTANAWGVVIGNRASEWAGAARIAARGEAFFRSQWVPLQRGLC